MSKLKVLDLFSGIGGFSLGLERAGMETVAFCEIEEYPRKVLEKYWPNVPIHEDVRSLTKEYLPRIDLVCGGFPCQPFSTAAAGKNPVDTLSYEYTRIVCNVRPRYAIAENTEAKAFSQDMIKALKDAGYGITPKYISAYAVGADHERGRWWLIAHPYHDGEFSSAIDAETRRMSELRESLWGAENYARAIRIPNGLPHRMDRLKCLGNAVIPQIPEIIGRAILEKEAE